MKNKEIEEMLLNLDLGNLEEVREMLIKEREKNNLRSKWLITVQKTFEKYAGNSPCLRIYGMVNEKFVFSNGASMYQLNIPLIISDKIKKSAVSREVKTEELEELLQRHKTFMGEDIMKAIYVGEDISPPLFSEVLIEREDKTNSQYFFALQIDYLKAFLGEDLSIYLSSSNPILFGESERGMGYVLGIRPSL